MFAELGIHIGQGKTNELEEYNILYKKKNIKKVHNNGNNKREKKSGVNIL